MAPDVSPSSIDPKIHRALQKYDPVVVHQLFLARAAVGAKIETTLEPDAVVRAVAAGADLGVLVRPLALEQVLHVDELGQLLPFGSTAFVPPLAHLVAFVVDPDEDLV